MHGNARRRFEWLPCKSFDFETMLLVATTLDLTNVASPQEHDHFVLRIVTNALPNIESSKTFPLGDNSLIATPAPFCQWPAFKKTASPRQGDVRLSHALVSTNVELGGAKRRRHFNAQGRGEAGLRGQRKPRLGSRHC